MTELEIKSKVYVIVGNRVLGTCYSREKIFGCLYQGVVVFE